MIHRTFCNESTYLVNEKQFRDSKATNCSSNENYLHPMDNTDRTINHFKNQTNITINSTGNLNDHQINFLLTSQTSQSNHQMMNHKNKLEVSSTDDAKFINDFNRNRIKSVNHFNYDNLINQKKEERRKSACNRERLRMKLMNQAFNDLRIKLPSNLSNRKRLAKIETLR